MTNLLLVLSLPQVYGEYSQEVKPLDSGEGVGGAPPMKTATMWETYGMEKLEAGA